MAQRERPREVHALRSICHRGGISAADGHRAKGHDILAWNRGERGQALECDENGSFERRTFAEFFPTRAVHALDAGPSAAKLARSASATPHANGGIGRQQRAEPARTASRTASGL